MPKGYYALIVKVLKSEGFRYAHNTKGSHERWVNDETGATAVVPKSIGSRHTANAVLKQAGLGKRL